LVFLRNVKNIIRYHRIEARLRIVKIILKYNRVRRRFPEEKGSRCVDWRANSLKFIIPNLCKL